MQLCTIYDQKHFKREISIILNPPISSLQSLKHNERTHAFQSILTKAHIISTRHYLIPHKYLSTHLSTSLSSKFCAIYLFHFVLVFFYLWGFIDGSVVFADLQVGSLVLIQLNHQLIELQFQILHHKFGG